MVVPLIQSISGDNDGKYARFAMPAMCGASVVEITQLFWVFLECHVCVSGNTPSFKLNCYGYDASQSTTFLRASLVRIITTKSLSVFSV
jgi:hypothetical protein